MFNNKQRDTCRLGMSELVTGKTELVAGCRRGAYVMDVVKERFQAIRKLKLVLVPTVVE